MESTGYGYAQQANQRVANVGQAVDPPNESPSRIRDAIGMAEELVSQLHGTIDRLEKRLDVVLTPEPPMPSTTENAKQTGPIISHLVGRIGTQNSVIQHAIVRLNHLMQRIEV